MSRIIRIIACLLWFYAGLNTGGLNGYLSAFASVLFIVAMYLEWEN